MKTLKQILPRRTHILFALVFPLAVPSLAIDIVVKTNADDGNGSFRQAIQINAVFGGGNTILFSNTVASPILLTSGELLIEDDVTIIGPGANVLEISGDQSNRVFNIGNSTAVNISGLTIANGYAIQTQGGGGILSRGTLV